MALYLVVAKGDPAAVKAKITTANLVNYEFKADTWIVESELSTNNLADSLGIREGDGASAGLAVPITTYAGRASTDMWEWLKTHWPTAA